MEEEAVVVEEEAVVEAEAEEAEAEEEAEYLEWSTSSKKKDLLLAALSRNLPVSEENTRTEIINSLRIFDSE